MSDHVHKDKSFEQVLNMHSHETVPYETGQLVGDSIKKESSGSPPPPPSAPPAPAPMSLSIEVPKLIDCSSTERRLGLEY